MNRYSISLLSALASLPLLLHGCAPSPDSEEGEPIAAPGAKADDGFENYSDKQCLVVLRSTEPDFTVDEYGNSICGRFGCTLTTTFDVRDRDASFVPRHMIAAYNSVEWMAWAGERIDADDIPDGYNRYRAQVYIPPAYPVPEIPLIPFVEYAQFRGWNGQRYFDHNINEGPFDDYVAGPANGWRVQDDPRWAEAIATRCR